MPLSAFQWAQLTRCRVGFPRMLLRMTLDAALLHTSTYLLAAGSKLGDV